MRHLGREIDMTRGGIMGKLIAFSLPYALSGVLQLLFNAADLVVIGQFSETGSQSLAAVSSNNALIHLIINVAIGLSVGANVVMAQAIGARNVERAQKTLHTSLLLALVCGLTVGAIGAGLSHLFLQWMNTDPAVIDKATTYLRIYFIGTPANIIYNFGAAILRAKGDTTRPLIFLFIAGVLNLCLNLIFVICLKLDVAGVGIATTISHCVSCALVIVALLREKGYCKLSLKKLRFHKSELLSVLRIGLPSGILSSFFSIANVIIQSSINGFGYQVMAGNSTGASLEAFVYTSMNSIAHSATTFAGQNHGAKRNDRVPSVLLDASIITVFISVVMGGIILIFAKPLASLYTRDPLVVGYAMDRMRIILPIYFVCGIVEILVGCLRGMNYSIAPMVPSLLCVCVYRIVWVYTAFRAHSTTLMLYLTYPISWILNIIMDGAIFAFVWNKDIRKGKATRTLSKSEEYVRVPALTSQT